VVAAEVMVMTPAIAHMIREAKTGLMFGAIQMGGRDGMQTMDAALVRLVRSGQISRAVAVERAQDEGEVTRLAG
jgi:twitching motility protein PilT